VMHHIALHAVLCHRHSQSTPPAALCSLNRAHGYGVKVFAKGDRHEGYYLNDKRSGFGTYFWANGDRFKGNWSEGVCLMLSTLLIAL
jgi:hypothetical protein